MDVMVQVLVVLAIGGGIAALAVYSIRKERARTEALSAVAGAMGFTFQAEGEASAFATLPVFNVGHSKKAKNLLSGTTAGHPVVLLDYQYTTGSGKNSHTHRQTIAVFSELGRGMPELHLAPENVFHKIGQVFGYQDIDFDTNEDFSKLYLLRGPDESAIRAAFGSGVLAFLAGEPGWSVQSKDGQLAVFRAGRRCDPPEQLPAFLADCLRIASGLGRS